MQLDLPDAFVWSRIGVEAGESLDRIVARKERERLTCDGMFLWGIGSSIGKAVESLLRLTPNPDVVFSPILGAPRAVDAQPQATARWRSGIGIDGQRMSVPDGALVTSRWDPGRPSTPRYALVCASDTPLALDAAGELQFNAMSNLVSGAAVGASQVTAVVRWAPMDADGTSRRYSVALRARLIAPYVLRLANPVVIGKNERRSTMLRLPIGAAV
jgi:hypothetical protein